jgi:hypothetical protein
LEADQIQELQKQLEETKGRLTVLEKENRNLGSLAAYYRANWINESRHAKALDFFGPDDAPCLSQAGWSSPLPDQSYGMSVAHDIQQHHRTDNDAIDA